MVHLPESVQAWGTPNFGNTLKQEILRLDALLLPLQQGLSTGSYALADQLAVTLISSSREEGRILAKVGLFYTSVIPGCNCADDPTPEEKFNEYCEALFSIDRLTGETAISLLTD